MLRVRAPLVAEVLLQPGRHRLRSGTKQATFPLSGAFPGTKETLESMARARALMTSMVAVAAGKGLTAIAGLLTIMVLTRDLGPHEFGYYRTVLTYAAFGSVLADLGIYLVGLREMSKPGADVARVVGNALLLRLVTTAAVLLAVSLVGLTLPYDSTVKEGIFLGAMIYTAVQGSEFLVAVFQLHMKQAGSALAEAGGALATLIAVWVLSQWDVGVLPMLCGTLFGALTALAISWTLARRLVPFRLAFEPATWRHYFVSGLPIAGSHILSMAMLRGDTLMLSLFKPAAAVGLYGVPTKMFELATSLPYMFAGLMMPLLAAAAARPGSEFNRLLGRSLDAMLVYGVGAMLALGACAPQLLSFISGPEFAEGAPALVVLAIAGVFTALSIVLRFSLIALDRPRFVLLADGASCAIALVAYFVLIPLYSLYGAAIGTAIAELNVFIAMLVGLRKAGQATPKMLASVKTMVAGGTAAGAIWLMTRLELNWMLALVIGGALYVTLLALTGALPREFMDSLRKKRRATGEAIQSSDG
jgi:O-antigen/teichoic acid export membrane protein